MINTKEKKASKRDIIKWELIFVLTNILLVILLSQRYTGTMDSPTGIFNWFYYINLTIGHFSFLLLLVFTFIFLPVSILIPSKKIIFSFNIITMSLIIALITIDTFVFDQYRFHISPFFIQMMIDAGDQVIGFSSLMWMILIFGIALIILTEAYIAKIIWSNRSFLYIKLKPKLLVTTLIVMYLISHVIHIVADANYDQSITRLTQNYPLLNPATAKRFMIKHGWAQSRHDELSTKLTDKGSLSYPLSKIKHTENNDLPNILLIVIDSWRFDAMTADITPNIYRLSQTAIQYSNHYSGANDTRTGIFSLFYGLPGNYWHAFESNEVGPVLIDSVLEKGYETGIFASAPLINPEFNRTVFTKVKNLDVRTDGDSAYKRDEKIVQKWSDWSNQFSNNSNNSPFFGFLFFDAIHAYQYPDSYPRKFHPTDSSINYFTLQNETDTTPIFNLYKNVTHYVDSLVGKVIDQLKDRGLFENTIILITGDHGQEINDTKQNFWGHNSNFSRFQTQVPLLIHWPGRTPEKVQQLTSHYDVVPTLMTNALGSITNANQYSIGRDLFSESLTPLDMIIFTNYSMISITDFKNDVMMIKNQIGNVDYLNLNYRPVDKKVSGDLILKAINDMRRFYK